MVLQEKTQLNPIQICCKFLSIHAEYQYEAKYQLLINKHEIAGLKHYNDPKAFIKYSSDIDVYENIDQ